MKTQYRPPSHLSAPDHRAEATSKAPSPTSARAVGPGMEDNRVEAATNTHPRCPLIAHLPAESAVNDIVREAVAPA
ncbi:hypothetical protein BI364_14035 [Acidihalobacter yilgarnensis]|uniref:Uncharacterized protein n=1 Tax=Acidihalobacter yilgarnensis TaxID=2819280 RepID=A0A1D8IRA3_9GAMM|nr:hypothetical protein BI364_14035 [Acidihalobacter yilgarnensis]